MATNKNFNAAAPQKDLAAHWLRHLHLQGKEREDFVRFICEHLERITCGPLNKFLQRTYHTEANIRDRVSNEHIQILFLNLAKSTQKKPEQREESIAILTRMTEARLPIDLSFVDQLGTTLSLAASFPSEDPIAVKILLDLGANPDGAERGYLPLCLAAHCHHYRLIPLLLDAGADPNKTERYGMNAIKNLVIHATREAEIALRQDSLECLRLLANHPKIDFDNPGNFEAPMRMIKERMANMPDAAEVLTNILSDARKASRERTQHVGPDLSPR